MRNKPYEFLRVHDLELLTQQWDVVGRFGYTVGDVEEKDPEREQYHYTDLNLNYTIRQLHSQRTSKCSHQFVHAYLITYGVPVLYIIDS